MKKFLRRKVRQLAYLLLRLTSSRAGLGCEHTRVFERKRREVKYFLELLVKANQVTVGDKEAFYYIVSALLSACRVVPAYLFDANHGFQSWYIKWEMARSQDERTLLEFLRKQRNMELHAGGAEIATTVVYVVDEFESSPFYGSFIFTPYGTEPAKVGIGKRSFKLGSTPEDVANTFRRFERLLQQLIADFVAAHPVAVKIVGE